MSAGIAEIERYAALAAAVIDETWSCLHRFSPSDPRCRSGWKQDEYTLALAFFIDPDDEPGRVGSIDPDTGVRGTAWSLEWCCQVISLAGVVAPDPDAIRQRARELHQANLRGASQRPYRKARVVDFCRATARKAA